MAMEFWELKWCTHHNPDFNGLERSDSPQFKDLLCVTLFAAIAETKSLSTILSSGRSSASRTRLVIFSQTRRVMR